MKRLSSWLMIFFMIVFVVFRVIVIIATQRGATFGGFISNDVNKEIIITFISIICFMLILKRNLIGAIIYLCSYIYYFGEYLLLIIFPNINNISNNIELIQNGFVAILGIAIAFFILMDVTLDQATKKDHKDKKTDWFFKDEKFERKLDERADKNQYRNY